MDQEAPKSYAVPDAVVKQPTLGGSRPDNAQSAQDFLETELPDQLCVIACRVCKAGIESSELAPTALQQVKKILEAAVGQGERDILALLALKLAGTPGADGSSDLAARALHDTELLLWMKGEFGPLVPTLPISVFAGRLQEVAADLLAQEKATTTRRSGTRATVVPEDRATLRNIAQEYEVNLETLRKARNQAASEGNDLDRRGTGSTTTYDKARLRALAEGLKQLEPKVKKNHSDLPRQTST